MEAFLVVLSPFTAVGVLHPDEVPALIEERKLLRSIAERCIAAKPGVPEAELHAYYNSCVEVRKQLKRLDYEEEVELEALFTEAYLSPFVDQLTTFLSSSWLSFSSACPAPPAHCGADIEACGEQTMCDVRVHLIQTILLPMMRALGVRRIELDEKSVAEAALNAQLNGVRPQSVEEMRQVGYIREQISTSQLYRTLLHASSNEQRQSSGDRSSELGEPAGERPSGPGVQ